MSKFAITFVCLAITIIACVWINSDADRDIRSGIFAICVAIVGSAWAICNMLAIQ